MNSRIAPFTIGVLALVCVALVLSVAYPFSTPEPHASNPSFSIEEADEFRVAGSYILDGEFHLGFEAIVTADDEQYAVMRSETVTSEQYQSTPDSDLYTRTEFPAEQAEERLDSIERDDEEVLVRAERDGDRMTIVTVEERSDPLVSTPPGIASLFIGSLNSTEYERVEDRSAVHVYEPRDGWFESDQLDVEDPYRITDSSGQVEIDADTHVVESANVSFVLTEGVDTYAHYAVAALSDDGRHVDVEQSTHEITYEFDEGDADLDVPDWVADARDER